MKSKVILPLLLSLFFASVAVATDAPQYRLANRFFVSGEGGGWDDLSFDADSNRLFITRGTYVVVVDAATGKTLGNLADTRGVHCVALAHDLGLLVTSNGRANTVSIFDLKTLQKRADLNAGTNPDAILYDPFSHLVFAFNGRSKNVTVLDPAKAVVITTIPLSGKPEFAATDAHGHIFVNIEDKNEIAAIDAKKLAVYSTWPLTGCESPSGLAIDTKYSRLFSVCDNQVMTVIDSTTGKLVATVPIGKHPDGVVFDPETHLAFSSNGEGTLTVVHQDSPDKYTVVQTVTTAPAARTLVLDPKSHTIYLVTAKFGPAPAPTAEQPHPRSAMIPGTFEVLVVSGK